MSLLAINGPGVPRSGVQRTPMAGPGPAKDGPDRRSAFLRTRICTGAGRRFALRPGRGTVENS